jgi:hypothetical protein
MPFCLLKILSSAQFFSSSAAAGMLKKPIWQLSAPVSTLEFILLQLTTHLVVPLASSSGIMGSHN